MGFPVSSERPLKIELPTKAHRVLLRNQGDSLYYGPTEAVSSTDKEGTLANGDTVLLDSPKFVRSAGGSVGQLIEVDNDATQGELDDAGKGFVEHGEDADALRPKGFASVEWVGSVEPENAIDGDTWIET